MIFKLNGFNFMLPFTNHLRPSESDGEKHKELLQQQFPVSLFRPLLNRVISSFMVAQ
jgi:hypothetical protein